MLTHCALIDGQFNDRGLIYACPTLDDGKQERPVRHRRLTPVTRMFESRLVPLEGQDLLVLWQFSVGVVL